LPVGKRAICATSVAGRVSWRLTINVPSVWRRRVAIRTQVRMLSRIDAQHLWMPRAASRVRIRCTVW